MKEKLKLVKDNSMQEWYYHYIATGDMHKYGMQWEIFDPGKDWPGNTEENAMERYISENPGKRPWPFWVEDDREKRRLLSGKLDPNASVYEYSLGIPSVQITTGEDGFLESWNKIDPRKTFYDPDDPPVYETQLAYLKRLKLLTSAEKKLLKSKI